MDNRVGDDMTLPPLDRKEEEIHSVGGKVDLSAHLGWVWSGGGPRMPKAIESRTSAVSCPARGV